MLLFNEAVYDLSFLRPVMMEILLLEMDVMLLVRLKVSPIALPQA
jgi:hypothetical protein